MKKALSLLYVLLILFPYAAADGMIFTGDRDMWYLQPESNQIAAIHYENGVENLLIAVSPGTSFNGSRAVWVFPVPASPDTVKLDILKGFPLLHGDDLQDKYSGKVAETAAIQIAYATFPACIAGGGPAVIIPLFVFGMAGSISKSSDVTVHEKIEKMGVTTELVTAKDKRALQDYLEGKGLAPQQGEQALLDSYIGRNYSFVISYISDVQKFKEASGPAAGYSFYGYNSQENLIGVVVRFPTDRLYYPLHPTSVYGTREIPVLLYVTGFVNPVLYEGIRPATELTYFTQQTYTPQDGLIPFFNGKTSISPLKYTKIKINVPADRFSDDLWIDNHPPVTVVWKETFMQLYILLAVIVYIVFSALASLIAGRIAFRKRSVDTKTLLLNGLWNCATFIGLAIATRKKFPQADYGKRGNYILAFYLAFAALLSGYAIALSPDLVGPVLIGWVLGLLSPIVALGLLLMIPMLLSSASFGGSGTMLMAGLVSVLFLVLALAPIPVLIWLKRWLDPEQSP